MREIEFRVFDKIERKMYPVKKINLSNKRFIYWVEDCATAYICICRIDDDNLMQYTGLKDKNGTKIYEDDIIYFKEENMYGLINFRYGGWHITWYGYVQCCNGVSWEEKYAECNEESLYSNCLTEEDKIPYEIVGNIYDNPELLKGENND